MNTEELLTEARSWEPAKKNIWSQLGSKYGLTTANRGQVIKEYLAEQDISPAQADERTSRAPRRSKKKLPGGQVSFPMYRPVAIQKDKVSQKMNSGEIQSGVDVVPTSFSTYLADKTSGSIVQQTTNITARKIPLIDIRRKLLLKHESQGFIRQMTDEQLDSLSEEELRSKLKQLHEPTDCYSTHDHLKDACKRVYRIRQLKMWHDHSDIAGHSHVLMLVAAVYDPAFFYTSQELEEKGALIDVQSAVEEPQIYILGRSRSSLQDQSTFSQCRRECLSEGNTALYTQSGMAVQDVLRFFHGDGPAQQFEAENNIGGHHCCVGCEARSSQFDDLAYCYRAHHVTLKERQ